MKIQKIYFFLGGWGVGWGGSQGGCEVSSEALVKLL